MQYDMSKAINLRVTTATQQYQRQCPVPMLAVRWISESGSVPARLMIQLRIHGYIADILVLDYSGVSVQYN